MTNESEPVTSPMRNPPHPGRALKGGFEALGLSVTDAAKALAVSRSQLHRVLAGESAISAELALKLEMSSAAPPTHGYASKPPTTPQWHDSEQPRSQRA